jgi:prophage regulatory protein
MTHTSPVRMISADSPRYLRLPAVMARYGCSRATVYAWIARGHFPAPIKLGLRLAAWRVDALETWESTRDGCSPSPRLRGPAILGLRSR